MTGIWRLSLSTEPGNEAIVPFRLFSVELEFVKVELEFVKVEESKLATTFDKLDEKKARIKNKLSEKKAK